MTFAGGGLGIFIGILQALPCSAQEWHQHQGLAWAMFSPVVKMSNDLSLEGLLPLLPLQVRLPWILRPLLRQSAGELRESESISFRIFLVATLLAPCAGQDDGEQEILAFCAALS